MRSLKKIIRLILFTVSICSSLVLGQSFANTLSGEVILPIPRDHSTYIDISLLALDENGSTIVDGNGVFGYEATDYVTIEAEETSITYEIDYSDAPIAHSYRITARCGNCGEVFSGNELYLQDDGGSGLAYNTVSADSVPLIADFELQLLNEVSGLVKLPYNEIAIDDIEFAIQLSTYSPEGNSSSSVTDRFVIESGDSEVAFALRYEPEIEGSQYQFIVECQSSSCYGNYSMATLALQEDGSLEIVSPFNQKRIDSIASNLILELIADNQFSGSIELPINRVAPYDMGVRITVETYDQNGDYVTRDLVNTTILEGDSVASYELVYPPAPSNWSHIVEQECIGLCGGFSDRSNFLQDDGSTNAVFNNVPGNSIPAVVDFVLLEKSTIEGQISLPGNLIAIDDIELQVEISSFYTDGQYYSSEAIGTVIKAGTSFGNYKIEFDPLTVDGSYQLSTRCYTG